MGSNVAIDHRLSWEGVLRSLRGGIFGWRQQPGVPSPAQSGLNAIERLAGEFFVHIGFFPQQVRPKCSRSDTTLHGFFQEWLTPDSFEAFQTELDACLRGLRQSLTLDVFVGRAPEQQWPVHICATLTHCKQTGDLLALDGVILDRLREHTRLQEALDTSEIRKQVLYSVGHDLGSPLGLINVSVSLLKAHLGQLGALTDKAERQLHRIVSCVLEANSYLKNAVDFTVSDQVDRRYEHFDLEIKPWLLQIVEAQALIYGIPRKLIRVRVPEGLYLQSVQEQALRMLATNLISNAVKYGARRGGLITVTLRTELAEKVIAEESMGIVVPVDLPPTGWVTVLEVKDSGDGLPERIQRELFKPFQRAEDRRDVKGMGLGLALVRHAAEALAARVELLPTGRGTHFRVVLPVTLRAG